MAKLVYSFQKDLSSFFKGQMATQNFHICHFFLKERAKIVQNLLYNYYESAQFQEWPWRGVVKCPFR